MKKTTEILTVAEFYARADRIIQDLHATKSKTEVAKRFKTSRAAIRRMTEMHDTQDDGLRRRIIEDVEGVEVEVLYQLKKP